MKIEATNKPLNRAFTLIEMIGVLAVIAILAAVLVPKVFEAINNSRINNAALSCDTVKTAIADHYAKFGGLNIDGSATPPAAFAAGTAQAQDYDALVLLKEQFLDKLFVTKIGDGINSSTNTHVELVTCPTTNGISVTATGGGGDTTGYNLGGTTNTVGIAAGKDDITGSFVAQAVITGVAVGDALALSQRIDGAGASAADTSTGDTLGRVKYAAPVGGVTTVYVYLTHR